MIKSTCCFLLFFLFQIGTIINLNAQEIKLRIPKGGVYNTASANFSPNGKYVITAQMDNTYNIWEVESGKFIGGALVNNAEPNSNVRAKFSPSTADDPEGGKYYLIVGDLYYAMVFETRNSSKGTIADFSSEYWISSADFSPDAKYILTSSFDNTASVWEATSGKIIHILKGHTDYVNHSAYSPDGEKIVTSSWDGTAKIWNAKTGKLILSLNAGVGVYAAKFSPVNSENPKGGKYILTETADSAANIWDAQSGKLLFQLKGHSDLIQKAEFSPDGKYVVTVSLDSTAIVWETETGKKIYHLKEHAGGLYDIAFSPDGEYFATASDDNHAIIWNTSKGNLVYKLEGHNYNINDVEFSPENKEDENGGDYLVTASSDGTIIIWDTKSGKIFQHMQGRTDPIWNSAFTNSRDLTTIAFSSSDSTMYVMDYSTGKILQNTKDTSGISTFHFDNSSPDPGSIFIAAKNGDVKKKELSGGKVIQSYTGHTASPYSIRSSKNGKYLVTASNDSTAIIWEIESGKLLHRLTGHDHTVTYAAFSPGGDKIVTASWDSTSKIWDTQSGNLLNTLAWKKDNSAATQACFSNSGDTVVIGYANGELALWQTNTGKFIKKLEGHFSSVSTIVFSKDGKKILSSSTDKSVILWDVASTLNLVQFDHSMDVSSAYFSLDEKFIYTSCYDGSINYWNVATGEKMLSQYIFDTDPNKWVHLHSSGLFDASPEAMELMYWTKGLEVIEFAQLKDRYWLPGLWEKVMKGEALPDVRNMRELKLQPVVELGVVKDGKIPVTITKREGGYGKVAILINGKEVQADARGENFDSMKETQTIYVDLKDHPNLQDGENIIAVKASSEDGFVTGRLQEKKVTMSIKKPVPHFYAVVVGTGKYANSSINLKYPEIDAKSMSTALKLGSEQLFGKDNTHIYTLTTGETELPTKEKIKSIFTEISTKASSSDVILVYLSGHGIAWGGDQGDFYYVTTEATSANSEAFNDESIRKNYTISASEFTEYVKKIPALKQVMIIDACNSGKAVENLLAARDFDVSQVKAIDRMKDRTGMFVISGSAADAVSYEASRYGQGLLTYSLLQAMKGASLRDGEFFDVNLLLNYARENVPKLAAGIGGIQTPQLLIPKGGSFDIGQVNDDSKKLIPLNAIKTVFVRSNMMNTDELEDNLGLGKMIDDNLNEIALKGTNAEIVFIDTREFPDAYRLSGGYTQNNEMITLKLKIKGPVEREQTLTATTKEELLEQILNMVGNVE